MSANIAAMLVAVPLLLTISGCGGGIRLFSKDDTAACLKAQGLKVDTNADDGMSASGGELEAQVGANSATIAFGRTLNDARRYEAGLKLFAESFNTPVNDILKRHRNAVVSWDDTPTASANALVERCLHAKGTFAVVTVATTTIARVALTRPDYVREITKIGDGLAASISTLVSVNSTTDAGTALTKEQGDFRTAANQLNGIAPRADARTAHERLIKAANHLADELDPIIAKVKRGNTQALASVSLLKGINEVEAALNALRTAGY
jgi:hypothetical protein